MNCGAPRVLVCDGDSRGLRALRLVLRDGGFDVEATASAEQALDSASLRLPDVAVIELRLPDGDGMDLCGQLREWSAMPLIVLSVLDEQDEKVRALDGGADDYITKPFDPCELLARLRAALRRVQRAGPEPPVELDGLEIDLSAWTVRRHGEQVHLTPTEFRLLELLVRHRGRLLTHSTLLHQVWGPAYEDATATLRTHIANLRRKIEPTDGLGQIRTSHGIGYRFAA